MSSLGQRMHDLLTSDGHFRVWVIGDADPLVWPTPECPEERCEERAEALKA